MILSTPNHLLRFYLDTTVTSQLLVAASWVDYYQGVTLSSIGSSSLDTIPVTIVPAPAEGVKRHIHEVSIYNPNIDAVIVTLETYDTSSDTSYIHKKHSISSKQTLQYTENGGWSVAEVDVTQLQAKISAAETNINQLQQDVETIPNYTYINPDQIDSTEGTGLQLRYFAPSGYLSGIFPPVPPTNKPFLVVESDGSVSSYVESLGFDDFLSHYYNTTQNHWNLATLNNNYVNTSGDTMTGQLIAPSISSTIYYGPTDSTQLSNSATNATRLLLRTNDARIYTGGNLNFQLNATNADFYSGKFVLSNENNRFIAPAVSATTVSAITIAIPTVAVDSGGTIASNNSYRSLTFSAITAGSFVEFKNTGLELGSTNTDYSKLYFGNVSNNNTPALVYDGVQALAQRRGTIAQTFRIYNTHTDASNYERAAFNWNSNTLSIGTEASGTGLGRQLRITTSGTPRMFFSGTGHRVDIGGDLDGANGLGEAFVSLNGYGVGSNNIVLRFYSHFGWTDYRIQAGINKNLIFTGRNSGQPENGGGFDFFCRSQAVNGTNGGLGAEGQIRLMGRGTDGTYGGFFRMSAFNDSVNRLGDVNFIFAQDIWGVNSSVSKWYRSGITEFYNTKKIYVDSGFNTSATLLDLSATWNTSATPTAIKLNIVDTSSNSNSKFLDFKVNNLHKFSIRKDGTLAWVSNETMTMTGDTGGNSFYFSRTGGQSVLIGLFGPDSSLQLTDSMSFRIGFNTQLHRDQNHIFAQRNSTTAQAFRIYNTYTDASNYERGYLDWIKNSNTFSIGTEASGTGSVRNLRLYAGNSFLEWDGTNLRPGANNLYNLGTWSSKYNTLYATNIDATNYLNLSATQVSSFHPSDDSVESVQEYLDLLNTTISNLNFDGPYVNTSGDTMTGPLVVASSLSAVYLNVGEGANNSVAIGGSRRDSGFTFTDSSYDITYVRAGSPQFKLTFEGLKFTNGGTLYWTSGPSLVTNPVDTTLKRTGPGVISVASSILVTSAVSVPTVYTQTIENNIGNSRVSINPSNLQGAWIYGNTRIQAGHLNFNGRTFIEEDAADIVALRNSTTAQTFRIYNTYTNASNYERGFLKWNSPYLEIGTEALGTGVNRKIWINPAGTGNDSVRIGGNYGGIWFTPNNFSAWNIGAGGGGNFTASIDNLVDIGAPTNNRPRNIYVASSVVASSIAASLVTASIVSATTYLNLSASIDAQYVNQTGDTMTGSLTAPELIVSQGNFTSTGDAQRRFLVMRGLTKNGTPTQLFVDGSSVRATIPSNTRWNAFVRIVASTDSFENRYATFDRKFLIVKADTNASTQIIGPVQNQGMDTGSLDGSPPVGWDVTVSADPTNGSLAIFGTGEVGTYVRWVAEVNLVQVSYEGNLTERTESLFANNEEGVWFDASGFDLNWRRNLLTYTEDFSNAIWSKANSTVSASVNAAPDGTFTASTITFNSGGSNSQFYQSFNIAFNNIPVTQSIWLRANTNTNFDFGFYDSFPDMSSITVTTTWQRFSRSKLNGFSGSDRRALWIYPSNYVNGLTLDIWHPQVEAGISVTPYQRIVTPDITFKSDIQTLPILYQDTYGTVGVTGVEQSIGLILDKSKNLSLGNNIFSDFTTESDWVDNGDGSWSITAATGQRDLRVDFAGTTGKVYEFRYTISEHSGTTLYVYHLNSSPEGNNIFNGTYHRVSVSNATYFIIRATLGVSAKVSNITIREISGNHAYQTTAANRPILRARYNLLTYSEQFDNAAWFKQTVTVSANAVSSPITTQTAERATMSTAYGYLNQTPTLIDDGIYSYSIHAKKVNANLFTLVFRNKANVTQSVSFNLDNGSVSSITGSPINYGISAVGDWYRMFIAFNASSGATSPLILNYFASNNSGGINGDQVDLWGAQLNYGSSATRYQRIAAATDYDTSGFLPYLDFDGTNDELITQNINLSSTNKTSAFIGVQPISGAGSSRTICSFGTRTDPAASAGYFQVQFDGSNNYPLITRLQGSVSGSSYYGEAGAPQPRTLVAALGLDISNPSVSGEHQMRINGVPIVGGYGGTQSDGNFGNYPLKIGSVLRGNLYSLIIRGTSTNNTLIPIIERYVAQQTGITFGIPSI